MRTAIALLLIAVVAAAVRSVGPHELIELDCPGGARPDTLTVFATFDARSVQLETNPAVLSSWDPANDARRDQYVPSTMEPETRSALRPEARDALLHRLNDPSPRARALAEAPNHRFMLRVTRVCHGGSPEEVLHVDNFIDGSDRDWDERYNQWRDRPGELRLLWRVVRHATERREKTPFAASSAELTLAAP